MTDAKNIEPTNANPDVDVDVDVEKLDEEHGAGSAGTAGTASCPATIGTAACW